MGNSFSAGKGMLKWPSTTKVPPQCRRQGHYQVPFCSLPPTVKRQLPQLWCPRASMRRQSLALLARAWARGEELSALCSQLGVRAGRAPAGRAAAGGLHWSMARAIVLLLFVHHPQDWQLHSYAVIVAIFAGNRNKAQCWH